MRNVAGGCRVFLLGALVLSGCGARALPDEGSISGLHFMTTSAFPENPPPTNVDVTLTDAGSSRAIYEATLALPDFPQGTFHCPVDLGYGHKIVFMSEQDATVTATLSSGGCRDATIAGAPPVRQTTDAYWALVAQNLEVEESTLFSVAAP